MKTEDKPRAEYREEDNGELTFTVWLGGNALLSATVDSTRGYAGDLAAIRVVTARVNGTPER